MYAIVDIAGQQFKVEEGQKIFVHRLDAEKGENVEFDKVLLIENDGKIIVGEPVIKDALIEGKVLELVRGDKVIVFKKKRKKGYRIKNGHRQNFTELEILSIKENGGPRKAPVKKVKAAAEVSQTEEVVVAEKKAAPKKAVVKKADTEEAVAKKPAAKKPAEKKPAAAKPAAKKPAKGKTE